jgi:hypothetical protein
MNTHLLRTGGLLLLVGVAACGDTMPVTPTLTPSSVAPSLARTPAAATSGEKVGVASALESMNTQLAARGSNARVLKAELLMDGTTWNGATSTVVFANDRVRGIGAEWVKADPRRGGRTGVTYAIAAHLLSPILTGPLAPGIRIQPTTRNPDGSNPALVPVKQLGEQIEEAMTAWRARTCSSAAIERVRVASSNPDIVDDIVFNALLGTPVGVNYTQPADIVQSGWFNRIFFRALAQLLADPNEPPPPPNAGDAIIGVTLTFAFIDNKGTTNPADDTLTDIDRNGKADTQLAEIYYNDRFAWGNNAALNVVDFYSIIAHETGHALGLGHFGKLFVTKKDAVDGGGIALNEIKYAPYALMNAAYITGRNEIAGTDNSSFCQIWASK